MSYLYIDDRFAQHPKVAGVSDRAFRAHVLALCYCGGHLTDGDLSRAAAKALGISARVAQELVSANLWEANDRGWRVHDYLDWQDSRDEVLARRTKASAAGKARARGAKREGGRFTSATKSTSGPLVETLVLAGPARPAEAPASPSPAPSPSPRELASPSLREVRDDEEGRLARAFAKIGCTDEDLARRLLADDAIAVIVEKVERLAETPGQPGASPTSRITNYLKACDDTLEEERTRVRQDRDQQARLETQERERRERREAEARIEAEGAIAPDHIVTLQQSLSRHLLWEPKDRKRLMESIDADEETCLEVAGRLDALKPRSNSDAIELLQSLRFDPLQKRVR